MDDAQADDAMVTVAALVSRVEALVVSSMLEAGGILVCVGGLGHASAEINSLALGGHRIWVPASQHRAASALLREVLGEEEWGFSPGLRRAILRVLAIWSGPVVLTYAIALWMGLVGAAYLALAPLSVLSLPVQPQGRGDYYLADTA